MSRTESVPSKMTGANAEEPGRQPGFVDRWIASHRVLAQLLPWIALVVWLVLAAILVAVCISNRDPYAEPGSQAISAALVLVVAWPGFSFLIGVIHGRRRYFDKRWRYFVFCYGLWLLVIALQSPAWLPSPGDALLEQVLIGLTVIGGLLALPLLLGGMVLGAFLLLPVRLRPTERGSRWVRDA